MTKGERSLAILDVFLKHEEIYMKNFPKTPSVLT